MILEFRTPLAWAVRRGHPEIAEMLKQHGAV
ncbi:ankyrin repeat domain-containing protein [Planctomyces sp. SH-PL14]|nr:ankyrin repeat domain-containing protein [Planctomyces sp. SH-PL14]